MVYTSPPLASYVDADVDPGVLLCDRTLASKGLTVSLPLPPAEAADQLLHQL